MKNIIFILTFIFCNYTSQSQDVLTAFGGSVQSNGGYNYSVCLSLGGTGRLSVNQSSPYTFQFQYIDINGQVYNQPFVSVAPYADFWMGTGVYRCLVLGGVPSVRQTNDVLILLADSIGSIYPIPNNYQKLSVVSSTCNQVNLKANFQQYLGYQWLRNDTLIPGATSSQYSASISGNYTCQLYNSCGWHFSDTLNITMPSAFAKPVITAPRGSFTNCQGGSILLTTPAVAGAHYKWIVNGTYSSQIGDTNQVNSLILNGNVKVVVTNNCKSDTSLAVTTSIYNNPLPTGSISVSSPPPYCGNAVLKAAYNIFYQYQWTKNGNPISGANDSAFTATSSGNYSCIVKNICGDSLIYPSLPITINAKPTSIISALNSTTVCNGASVSLTASSGTGYTWQWMKGTSNLSGAISSTYSASATGSYKVVITNASGCSKTSNIISVSVKSNPSATVTSSGPLSFCAGDSVVLSANAGTGYSYQWKKNTNSNIVSLNQIYTAKTAGTYWVQVSNSFGCTRNSSTKVVTSISCREEIEFTKNDILIYPNPSNNYFEVHSSEMQLRKIQVADISGRIIEKSRPIINDEKIGESWSRGIYFLQITEGDKSRTIKLIKSN